MPPVWVTSEQVLGILSTRRARTEGPCPTAVWDDATWEYDPVDSLVFKQKLGTDLQVKYPNFEMWAMN